MKNKLHMSGTVLFLSFCLIVILLSFLLKNQTLLQLELIIGAVVLYIGYAFWHHHLDKSLTVSIIVEYILVAAFIIILLASTSLQR